MEQSSRLRENESPSEGSLAGKQNQYADFLSGRLKAFHYYYFHIVFISESISHPKRIGFIEAEVVDRTRIRLGAFHATLGAHSDQMGRLALTMFENKQGRTLFPALEEYDQYGLSFLFITKLFVTDPDFHKEREDIGTAAIYQLLNHSCIRKGHPISSAYCLLDDTPERTPEELAKHQNVRDPPVRVAQLRRQNATQYLRNGFSQGTVYNKDNIGFLVARYPVWKRPPISHNQAPSYILDYPSCVSRSMYDSSDSSDDEHDKKDKECMRNLEMDLFRMDETDLISEIRSICRLDNVNWEDICDRTAISILVHEKHELRRPQCLLSELRWLLRGVMNDDMIQKYGERVVDALAQIHSNPKYIKK